MSENVSELTRKGKRRNAGADTPSGPNTERSAVPAERENCGKNPNDILPSTNPETVREIEKERTPDGSTGRGSRGAP